MQLTLARTYLSDGTNGDLLLNGEKVCSTIELPWKNNKSRISCIPEGTFELKKRYTPKFGKHFIVVNVPRRNCILIHPANDASKELKGCIAPVTLVTGAGQGTEARRALAKVVSLLYPAID